MCNINCDENNEDYDDGYNDIDTDIYYPVKKHSFFCRDVISCRCKYYPTNYMVQVFYPVINHSFLCLNRKANNYACACNYGITYKTKYVHCSEVKSPYDLYMNDYVGKDISNLYKYCFWLVQQKKKKKLNLK